MMYLVIDTETSGLPDYKQPADAPGQPRLASVAFIQLNEHLSEQTACEFFIRPDGWEMTPEATQIHGLTTAFLQEHGEPIRDVLEIYTVLIRNGLIVLSYGAQFDCKIMRGELRRAGMDDLFEQTSNICLMRACTPVCQLPGKFGFKWPKLQEACAFFGIEQEEAHGALGDAWAAAEIARHLRDLNRLPEAQVYYSKTKV